MVCKVVFNEEEAAPLTFGRIYDEYARRYNNRTGELYDTTKRQISAFDKQAFALPIADISYGWLQRFSEWSLTHQHRNTLNIRLRCIRAVFNYAVDMEYTNTYPFRKIKIKNEDVLHTELTAEQLQLFLMGDVPDSLREGQDIAKIIFYLIGINIKDLWLLTPSSIAEGRVRYIRSKTHKRYSIKIEDELAELLAQYTDDDKLLSSANRYSNDRNFGRWVNNQFALICAHLHLPKISTGDLRVSWATFAHNTCGVPKDVVSEALGHSFGVRVTTGYIIPSILNADQANRVVIDKIKG